jgi:hypothetical protein
MGSAIPGYEYRQRICGLIANHFGAQYTTTCRSGIGMVCELQGDTTFVMPKYFCQDFNGFAEPKWILKIGFPM